MSVRFRMTASLFDAMVDDLRRPHAFAYERVGFLYTRSGTGDRDRLVLGSEYVPVADEDYLDEPGAAAWIGADAIRKARARALTEEVGVFHVHLHEHRGRTSPSSIDAAEMRKVVPSFVGVAPDRVHGAIVLSLTDACVASWSPAERDLVDVETVAIVGFPYRLSRTS